VNDLKLYYEIQGSGAPLILMHGGLGSIQMFSAILPTLTSGRQVIAVDLQAHGADVERPLSYGSMAEDIGGLLKYLGIEKTDVMGYSLGAGVAVRTTVHYPEVVRKLVVVSTPYKHGGW
jgi:pimeloyl-ACP methyl ester carboxylesterase